MVRIKSRLPKKDFKHPAHIHLAHILQDSILKYNPISSNSPPPVNLDDFLKGNFEEDKQSCVEEDKFSKKCNKNC